MIVYKFPFDIEKSQIRIPSGYLTWPWKIHPFLRTVNHLFRLGPSIPWRTVSHNQRLVPMETEAPPLLVFHQASEL